MNINTEFKLSLYEELKSIHKSRKVEIFLVQNIQDEKIYIKKEIKEYTKEIYESIKNIDSKNIPKIYEILEKEDKLIIIEEFINGDTLQTILEKENKLKESEVIKYMISLCDVLNEIHSLNPPIIHRDIKPANIIISNDNVLKLIDFDISRTYKEGESLDTTLLGTKGYASPEQFGFDQTDCRSDIYAMGVMMNVLTTGKHIKEELNNTLLKDKGYASPEQFGFDQTDCRSDIYAMGVMMNVLTTGKHIKEELNNTLLKDIIKKCTHISAEKRYDNVIDLKVELKNKLYNEKKTENQNKINTKYYTKKEKLKQ